MAKSPRKKDRRGLPALFLDKFGDRLSTRASSRIVRKHAVAVGLHKQSSKLSRDRLSPHSLRYYFTTRMHDAGMSREFIQCLRGDAGREAFDIYNDISMAAVKQSYLETVPKLDLL